LWLKRLVNASFKWRKIRYRNVISLLKNPCYVVAYAFDERTHDSEIVDVLLVALVPVLGPPTRSPRARAPPPPAAPPPLVEHRVPGQLQFLGH
jgi:hypothetical protein